MKRLLVVVLLAVSMDMYAEDIIQIIPVKTTAGVKYTNGKMLEISMTNTFDVANLQFDMLLPEGMAVSSNNSEFTERAKTYDEDEEDYVEDFTWSSNKVASGYTRIVFTPQTLNPIKAGSGTILKLRYKTEATMAPGIYPILMEKIELDKSVTEGVKDLMAVSYVIIGDLSSSYIDLSTMTGYIPSFVVEQLNTDLATNENLTIVDLSGATGLGADLETPENVVSVVGTTGSLKREFTATYWSTVCLPFAVSAAQVSTLNDNGVEIEQLSNYDGTNVSFEAVSEMVANTPYLVRSSTDLRPFSNLTNVILKASEGVSDVEANGMTMVGTFLQQTISSDENTTYYAFDASDGAFVKVGSNVTVPPFRAYLKLSSAGASRLAVSHYGQNETGISRENFSARSETGKYYNLMGIPQNTDSMQKGVHIRNGQKIVVK